MSKTRDIGVVTDVCNSADPDEVEILSLIEEQIPKYRLRADTITEFSGYNHEDWIQTPLISLDEDLELSDEQIKETLKYFILCAERVTQMTRTYNDIEALTRMLEEKERDLELAARIGQTLLEKNKDLSDRTDNLEDQLTSANDKVSQLRHDLSMKDELLRFYCQDVDNEENNHNNSPDGKGFNLDLVKVGALQKKVISLEEENLHLRLESAQLRSETTDYEDKEKKLVEDCLQQLAEVNLQVETFAEELSRKTEECSRHKEEVTALLAQVVDLQKRVRCLTIENMELSKHLQASQESQRKLTKELGEQHDKYDELLELLAEAQEELKTLRGKQRPGASRQYLSSSLLHIPSDSLASELETSLKNNMEFPKGYSPSERRAYNWKIFETAKAAKKASSKKGTNSNSSPSNSLSPSGVESADSNPASKRASFYFSDGESVSDGYSADMDSLHGSNPDLGRPGIPGSNDLETSLKRLAMRRANDLNERDYHDGEEKRKNAQASFSTTPNPCRTPESINSPGSGLSYLSFPGSHSISHFRIPEKLQIIKPMEGSVTLRQWQQLATPNLGGIFEERPGVQIKGERKLELEEEVYTLSDFEEDDDFQECPSKRYNESSTIYTFTDSTVRHPSEFVSLTPAPSSSSLSSIVSTAVTPMASSTPKPRMATTASMKRSTTSTYSMSLGLAAILNERDLVMPTDKKGGMRFNQSYPARLPSIVSETPYSLSTSKSTEVGVSTVSSVRRDSVMSASSSGTTTPTDTRENGGIINKLKSKGFSFYEYLGGKGGKDETPNTSTAASTLTPSGSATSMATAVTLASVDTASPTEDRSLTKVLFTQGASAGVLGALTSFRRSGIL